jgi:hypothetical protein
MCDIGYHHCPQCGDEINCELSNAECDRINHYEYPCDKCEYWDEENAKEMELDERRRWEQAQYELELQRYERDKYGD